MISKSSDSIQAVQSALKRTYVGRVVSDRAKKAVDSWAEYRSKGYEKSECKSCGIILTSNYFANGCINCGSTDVKQL
jgi:hypothetical protein